MPVKNDDPKTKQIEELKSQVKLLTSELMKANQHIEFLSQLTGQKIERFGDQAIKRQLELVSGSGNQHNASSSNILYQPTVYNQNVVIHQNEELQRKSSQSFLPKINGQSA